MEEYIKGVIDESPDDMKGESPTPAPRMGMRQAASAHATSTSAISLLPTRLMMENLKYNTVPQLK